jgi:hypothetical protein
MSEATDGKWKVPLAWRAVDWPAGHDRATYQGSKSSAKEVEGTDSLGRQTFNGVNGYIGEF